MLHVGVHPGGDTSRMLDSGVCVAKVRQILQPPQGAVFVETIFRYFIHFSIPWLIH